METERNEYIMTDYTRTQLMVDEDEKREHIKGLLSDNGIEFDTLPYIELMDYDGIVNSMGFYKTVLTELPEIKDRITSIEDGSLAGDLDGMFNISETSEGLIRISYSEAVDEVNGESELLKKIKITDSEHLAEDFEALNSELKYAIHDYYNPTLTESNVTDNALIIDLDDLQTFEPDQEPKYVAARLPEPTLLSNVDHGVTEDEDMEISEVVFKLDTYQKENGRVSGEIVGVRSNLGLEIIDPEETGAYKTTDLEILDDMLIIDFDNLPNDELTISADDLPNISNNDEISL